MFWWGCGFALLCLVLLVTAYIGARALRRTPEMVYLPADPVIGELTLSRDYLIATFPYALAQVDPQSARALRDENNGLRKILGDRMHVKFLAPKPGHDAVRWVAFLPILRPHRIYAQRLKALLQETAAFQQFGTPGETSTGLGYIGYVPEGIYFSSEIERPAGRLVLAKSPRTPPLAQYESATGFLPKLYRRELDQAPPPLPTEGQPIQLNWTLRPERRITLAQSQAAFPWFDPLLPGLEKTNGTPP